MAEPAPILEISELSVSFARARRESRGHAAPAPIEAVRAVSLHVAPGECLGVVGESGSGKTQLFLAALGLLPGNGRARGSVRFEAEEILGLPARQLNRLRGARLGMVFQDPMTSLTPHLRVGKQLAEVRVQHAGEPWRAAYAEAARMLERVGIADAPRRLRQFPHELSGGMRQRVMIGMSLMCGPRLLIADEPTTALDVRVQARILELLDGLRGESGMALVLISHDLAVVGTLASRIAVMYAGRIVECAPADALLSRPRHPYTAALLACAPRLEGPRRDPMPTLPGQAPDPAHVPSGCAFAPRCPRAAERCRRERPSLAGAGAQAVACHFPEPAP